MPPVHYFVAWMDWRRRRQRRRRRRGECCSARARTTCVLTAAASGAVPAAREPSYAATEAPASDEDVFEAVAAVVAAAAAAEFVAGGNQAPVRISLSARVEQIDTVRAHAIQGHRVLPTYREEDWRRRRRDVRWELMRRRRPRLCA